MPAWSIIVPNTKSWNKATTKTEKCKAFLISTEMIATIKTQMDGKKRYADVYITFKSQSVFWYTNGVSLFLIEISKHFVKLPYLRICLMIF